MSSRRRPGAPCDFEEMRPGLFIIHNPALGPTLRGEGDREGDRFTLTSQRGEGLVARLRARSFSVLTLADQAAGLPGLPTPAPPGEPRVRQLAAGERVSYFAAEPLGWAPAPEAGPGAVSLREGWPLRRRRSRGSFSYHQLVGGALAPLDEDLALRIGYAQIALAGPLSIPATPVAGGHLLPDIPLPAAHRRLLGRAAARTPQGWLVPPEGLHTAAAILARLGIDMIA
ncbi:hypothetical protein K2Z83_05280 [Oscillochloris sp. ZM17-4]|uniref:hypothetical protein n=1 Tax=Oscillochloris sp. ZM17-4 TaxID=2866714 RepID=UPI001C72A63B|nr:hypothetical protein [Oscillochloris sp. ZM17-4]MBX0327095.1 hypothetical protein [Oscillochloris sp. ZM17-4]